jgi:hypothetical protein
LIEDAGLARFQLGAPFWDILMPILASFHGPVKFLAPPFILHAVHAARWSDPDYRTLRNLAVETAVNHAARYADTRPNARAFLRLTERFVGHRRGPLGRRAVRNLMLIFGMWIAKMEAGGGEHIDVDVDGTLSAAALRQLEGWVPETPTDAESAVAAAAAPPFSPARGRWWVRTRLRELKRARRERAIRVRLAEVDL